MFPVQADGIAHEIFSAPLYESKRKKIRRRFLQVPEELDFEHVFWRVVVDQVSVSVGLREPVPAEAFNRKGILHGRSLDYGTHANSVRAILLLHYLRFVVEQDERRRAQQEKVAAG